MGTGAVISLTLISCIVVFGLIFAFVYLGCTREKQPPKCLGDIDWEIWCIDSNSFKRLTSNTAKISVTFQYTDHGTSYLKHKKCIIEYIEKIPIIEQSITQINHKTSYEVWKLVNEPLAKDKFIFYNRVYWVYDNKELENNYRGRRNNGNKD